MLVFKGSVGTGGTLARVSGFGQHDSFLHGRPGTLPSQRDHQLPDPHLLVHPTGQSAVWDQSTFLSSPLGYTDQTFWFLDVQDDILSFEEEKQAVYLQVYRPVYFQLVDVLLYKSHYPPEEDYSSWSSDDKEQFRIYRRGQKPLTRVKPRCFCEFRVTFLCVLPFRVDISDTLMYVYEMLGAELLSNLYDRLGRQLVDPQLSAVWQVMSLPIDPCGRLFNNK